MSSILIRNATIVNEDKRKVVDLFLSDGFINNISDVNSAQNAERIIDAKGLVVLPGIIDDQVHFREPGLTHKGSIYTESRAAAAGGITSFMEMPNTLPQATSHSELERKYDIAEESSLVNYSFYLGATNDNIEEIKKINAKNICGVKVFMGSSTGNMLVNNQHALHSIFAESPVLVATHCEDEETIQTNTNFYKNKYGDSLPFSYHPIIRSEEACYKSSAQAVDLAVKYGTKLHILHLSTEKELSLLDSGTDYSNKKITGEVCVHHLWFNDLDYDKFGARIKWNPAVKKKKDQEALLNGLIKNKLDVVATDHAPHTLSEKNNSYFKAPSGGPLVQHALVAMLELHKKDKITLETIVRKMCHNPADLYQIKNRGYIKEGYKADLVIVNLDSPWTVSKENILYKCGWSPFEGTEFSSEVKATIVNGKVVYEDGKIIVPAGERLLFDR